MTEERTAPPGRTGPPARPAERSDAAPPGPEHAGPGSPGWAPAASPGNPVLEPLFRSVRANHPKADLALLERAYLTAEKMHGPQMRKSGDPYITHPLAVTTILADIGMTEPTLVASLLHDTVEDTPYTPRAGAGRLRRRGRPPRRRRDQARQGHATARPPKAETIRKMIVAMVARHPGAA